MKALLAHGAEVDLPNVFQITPLMAAAGMSGIGSRRRRQVVAAAGRRSGDTQARAIKSMDLLLDAGANINARVTDSRTHTAKIMAYVQGRDQEGRTALFAAAEAGWDRWSSTCSIAARTRPCATPPARPRSTSRAPRPRPGPERPRQRRDTRRSSGGCKPRGDRGAARSSHIDFRGKVRRDWRRRAGEVTD